MIKTLRITGIAIGILAVCFIGLSATFGLQGDENKAEFLSKPGVVERFKNQSEKPAPDKGQVSPLVKQAQAFALRINPPAPKEPHSQRPTARRTKPRPRKVSAKFLLIGTCYYPTRPAGSLALIDIAGKGLRWVRQGEKAGHLTIEQVREGFVVINDGEMTYELEAEERPQRANLVKSASLGPPEAGRREARQEALEPTETLQPIPESKSGNIRRIKKFPPRRRQRGTSDPQKAIDLLKMVISKEEANRLRDLGPILKDLEQSAAAGKQQKKEDESDKPKD